MKKLILPSIILASFALSTAYAGPLKRRQARINHRIAKGVQHDRIDRREARKIRRAKKNLRKTVGKALADDQKIDLKERKIIKRKQRRLARKVHRANKDSNNNTNPNPSPNPSPEE